MNDLYLRNKTWMIPAVIGTLFLAGVIVILTGPVKKYVTLKRQWSSVQRDGYTLKLDQMNRQAQKIEGEVSSIDAQIAHIGIGPRRELIPAWVRYVEKLAIEEGVVVGGLTPGPPMDIPPLTQTPFQMTVSGPYPPLQRFLMRREKSRPPVQLEGITLVAGSEGQQDLSLSVLLFSLENPSAGDIAGEPFTAVFRSDPDNGDIGVTGTRKDIFSYASYRMDTAKPIRRASSQPETKPSLREHLRLTAIFFDGPRSMALVEGVPLRIGDFYKGYKVVSIEKDRISLADKEKKVELVLRDK
jgi:hypothetical protein